MLPAHSVLSARRPSATLHLLVRQLPPTFCLSYRRPFRALFNLRLFLSVVRSRSYVRSRPVSATDSLGLCHVINLWLAHSRATEYRRFMTGTCQTRWNKSDLLVTSFQKGFTSSSSARLRLLSSIFFFLFSSCQACPLFGNFHDNKPSRLWFRRDIEFRDKSRLTHTYVATG